MTSIKAISQNDSALGQSMTKRNNKPSLVLQSDGPIISFNQSDQDLMSVFSLDTIVSNAESALNKARRISMHSFRTGQASAKLSVEGPYSICSDLVDVSRDAFDPSRFITTSTLSPSDPDVYRAVAVHYGGALTTMLREGTSYESPWLIAMCMHDRVQMYGVRNSTCNDDGGQDSEAESLLLLDTNIIGKCVSSAGAVFSTCGRALFVCDDDPLLHAIILPSGTQYTVELASPLSFICTADDYVCLTGSDMTMSIYRTKCLPSNPFDLPAVASFNIQTFDLCSAAEVDDMLNLVPLCTRMSVSGPLTGTSLSLYCLFKVQDDDSRRILCVWSLRNSKVVLECSSVISSSSNSFTLDPSGRILALYGAKTVSVFACVPRGVVSCAAGTNGLRFVCVSEINATADVNSCMLSQNVIPLGEVFDIETVPSEPALSLTTIPRELMLGDVIGRVIRYPVGRTREESVWFNDIKTLMMFGAAGVALLSMLIVLYNMYL